MIIVYVKHYLNIDGMQFFNNTWFPAVEHAISKQKGFISIITEKDKFDNTCVHIELKFESRNELDEWTKTKVHDELVDQLDPYRLKAWEVAKIQKNKNECVSPGELKWESVTPSKIYYEVSSHLSKH